MKLVSFIATAAIMMAGVPRPCCCFGTVLADASRATTPACPHCPSDSPVPGNQDQGRDCPSGGCPCKMQAAEEAVTVKTVKSPTVEQELGSIAAASLDGRETALDIPTRAEPRTRTLAKSGPAVHVWHCLFLC